MTQITTGSSCFLHKTRPWHRRPMARHRAWVLHKIINPSRNDPLAGNPFDCAAEHGVLFEQGGDQYSSERRCTMRDEFASYSFLAVTVAGLVLLCSGLVAITFT